MIELTWVHIDTPCIKYDLHKLTIVQSIYQIAQIHSLCIKIVTCIYDIIRKIVFVSAKASATQKGVPWIASENIKTD